MNTKLMENAYSELHKFLIEHNLAYLYFVVILIGGLLFLLGWIISARKSNAEIEKIKSENRATEIDNISKRVELSKKIAADIIIPYSQKYAIFQTLFNELIDKVKYKDKKLVINAWGKVKSAFDDLLINFLSYFDYVKRFGESKEEKTDFVNTVALIFLNNVSDFKESIKSEELSMYIGSQNSFNNHIIKQLIEFSADYIEKENKDKLNEYIKVLNN